MKQTKLIMGMPITVEIIDDEVNTKIFKKVFDYFRCIDAKYSTYKPNSEISQINRGLPKTKWSNEMKQVLELCEQTKQQTGGFFDIERDGKLDPSGLVKGWSINNAVKIIKQAGYQNFYIDAGGDIQVNGLNADGNMWRVGIRNPFNRYQNVKIVDVKDRGIATSGTYVRGHHIYNPKTHEQADEIASITVIGPNIYNADRLATAAFAMGKKGVQFIEKLRGFEAYLIKKDKTATMTGGFERYIAIV